MLALTQDKVQYVLFVEAPAPLGIKSTITQRAKMDMWNSDYEHARTLIFSSMDDIYRKKFKKMDLQSIFLQLKDQYGDRSRETRLDLSRKLFHTKMAENSSVGDHVLKMIGWIEELANLVLSWTTSCTRI